MVWRCFVFFLFNTTFNVIFNLILGSTRFTEWVKCVYRSLGPGPGLVGTGRILL